MIHRTLVSNSILTSCLVLAACSSEGRDETRAPVEETPGEEAGAGVSRYAEPFKVSITIPGVAPGEEGTKCAKVRLGNSTSIKVGKVHNTLSPASHHLVVSTVDDPAETESELFECRPFRAVLIGAPLTVTQKHDDLITMPENVGFPLEADQLMHLEMHYINTGDAPADVTAEAELYPYAADDDIQEASFIIVGNLDIHVPPKSDFTTPPAFVALPEAFSDVTFYAATGHTHRFGTSAKLSVAGSAEDEGNVVYDPQGYTWEDAQLEYFEPSLKVPAGGGFRFQCSWHNPTDTMITYGESALQEMCFFWTYYYPRTDGPRTLLTGFENSPYAQKPKDAGAADAN